MSTIVKDNNKNYLAIAFKHLLTALLIAMIGSWCFQLLYPAIAGIFTNTAKNEISVNLTLKEVQEELTKNFIQIHRSIIVNKDHIKKIEHINNDLYVVLTNDIKEIVSKRKEKEIKACITHLQTQ